jgi:membrane associated rhomboid family serine protease
MLFPLSTDQPLNRRPVVTNTLITVNLLTFLALTLGTFLGWSSLDAGVDLLGVARGSVGQPWRLVTYQFMHDPNDLLHLLFNMLFLWIFGRNVECSMGRWTFGLFYLAGGVIAALAHMTRSEAIIVGASGSICAVTGAFIILFPRSRIRIFVFFLIIGVFMIPSMWFVAFYMVMDLLQQTMEILGRQSSHVAYMAHLAGYVCGIVVAITLLATKRIRTSQHDLLYLLKQRRRRLAFKGAMKDASHQEPHSTSAASRQGPIKKSEFTEIDPSAADAKVIARSLSHTDTTRARQRFAIASAQGRTVPLSLGDLQLLATEYWTAGDARLAVTAWRQYIQSAPDADDLPQIQLLMAVALIRHLDDPEDAASLLEASSPGLTDASERSLLEALRQELVERR